MQVADAGGEALHLAEAAMDRLEPVADELERLAEPLLERAVQLLVDRLAHLLELGLVALGKLREAAVDEVTDGVQAPLDRLAGGAELHVERRPHALESGTGGDRQRLHLPRHLLELAALQGRHLRQRAELGVGAPLEGLGHLLALPARGDGGLLAAGPQLAAQRLLEAEGLLGPRLLGALQVRRCGAPDELQQPQEEQRDEREQRQRGERKPSGHLVADCSRARGTRRAIARVGPSLARAVAGE